MNKIKKVLIVRHAFQKDFGGGERYPVMLANELSKDDYVACVGTNHKKIRLLAKQLRINTTWVPWLAWQNFSGWRLLFFPAYVIWQLWLLIYYISLILMKGYDVLHLQSRDDFIAGALAGRLLGKTVIWTDHADLKYIFANHQKFFKNPMGKLVYATSKFAHAVILVSNNEKRHITDEVGHELGAKFQVIHNGVSEQKVRLLPREKDSIIFCSTSRLVSTKGIGELIEAFLKVNKSVPSTMLWIVGEGPETEIFRKQAAQHPSIVFVGYPDNALDYLATSDVFVHPSYHEGFSLSIVEAAMLSKPIIACDVGGNPEIIQHGVNGILIPPKSSTYLAEAMTELATNPKQRERFGKAARETYKKGYGFETIVKDKILRLYEGKNATSS